MKPIIFLMNRTIIFRVLLAAAVVSGSFAANRAQAQANQTAVISGTELLQNGDPSAPRDNGTTTTLKAPTRLSISTATLLKDLAVDETAAANWFNATGKVPPNARLRVAFAGMADFSSLSFQVVSGTNVIDVNNILSAGPGGNSPVVSFTYNDNAGEGQAPFSQTQHGLYTITYDSTGMGGTTTFTVTGAATCTSSATKPNARTGLFTETDGFTLSSGVGDGAIGGVAFVLSGVTITASGTVRGDCGCGTDGAGDGSGSISENGGTSIQSSPSTPVIPSSP